VFYAFCLPCVCVWFGSWRSCTGVGWRSVGVAVVSWFFGVVFVVIVRIGLVLRQPWFLFLRVFSWYWVGYVGMVGGGWTLSPDSSSVCSFLVGLLVSGFGSGSVVVLVWGPFCSGRCLFCGR